MRTVFVVEEYHIPSMQYNEHSGQTVGVGGSYIAAREIVLDRAKQLRTDDVLQEYLNRFDLAGFRWILRQFTLRE
jgi:hypothetical protein